ncbi:phenylacetic acid degradation bifunctional protein PaaZ [Pseudooceanicola sp. CBS1P-1]|uniref:Phenylacetic acid degradation bifunctional protein PaaZ n=1 Tax=Pseudooceanicola albus TaxID=2692189 RepID=A0A6L7G5X7_9RHOB|nr:MULTISPECIES: phenylacetic acid degradation bifunctional protein PaaZ [Pseudooceanicola]MBT9385401.1 phenylacetic acid degradation bifunctional protein PaaZ [Pseudooceanicola endophyticus]MXN18740.1 phenylacetic acid degradation bifunctional protein PaaZ [Pseudooceanicola albus]
MKDTAATPRRLESYVAGAWRTGHGEGQPVLNAATGAVHALIGTEGLDMAEALDFGRRSGGPALRAMTIHDRALMLKAIGLKLLEIKEEFYLESFATGATRKDGWIDIEGGIGTMLTFASMARREFPNAHVLTEGPVEMLSRDGSFVGQHILSPMQGVAVHINAFNFPVWGMLEKIAPSLIAGMPVLVKPASQTAYLTELVVRRMLDTGLLPAGALQIVTGPARDLLEHVSEQDVVTFTGSAATGRKLRAGRAVVEHSVRFTMEADSLNAAILGADAGPGSEEFDLFVRDVAHEMTAKAGQKCTAVRRILVPAAHEEALIGALSARLAKTVIGLPDDAGTRMGALVSLSDREGVRAKIAELAKEAEVVFGTPNEVSVASGDAEAGAFQSPVLLRAQDPLNARAPHEVEAFGPVATVMAYGDADEAVALARMGRGSLVSSVYSNDAGLVGKLVTGVAPFHGRVHIGNRGSAKSSTGHGSPLAPLVHGGPGRAGGGEEMGGMRGVKHFMQRSALQGTPEMLSAVTGQWVPGAPAQVDVHPFRKSLAELKIGDQVVTAAREITEADVEHFAHFTGDTFYAHMDSAAARANPFFDDRVAHGYLIASFAAGLFVWPDPGPVLANYGVDNLRFLTPVYFGDSLKVRLTCKQINPRAGGDYGEVRWDCCVTKQDDTVVAQYDVLTMVAKVWPPAGDVA